MSHSIRSLAAARVALALPLAMVLAAPTLGVAQRGGDANADSVGPRVDRIFAQWDKPTSPGCATGIARDGHMFYAHGYGSANLEYGVPITDETVFESGSVAKQFTAAAIVLLAQDGKLSLDDDIRRYVPEAPDFGQPVTIRMLLHHTSGLRDQWGLLGIEGLGPGSQVHSPATTVDLVAHQKALNFPPNTQYLYSNTGFALLGVIVQRVSGQSLPDFTRARLFAPLGMAHTQWRDDFTRVVKNRATAYEGTDKAGFRTDMPFTNMIGNGGLLLTVGDALIWNENLDNPRVGGRALVDTMETRGRLRNGREITYASGLEVSTYDGVREASHSGSTAGYRTFLARYPDQHLSLAVLCNLGSANPVALGHQVADLFLPRRAPTQAGVPSGPQLSPSDEARWLGTFRNTGSDAVFAIELQDGHLVANRMTANGRAVPLAPYSSSRLQLVSRAGGPGAGDLLLGGRGGTRVLRLATADGDTAVFDEVRPSTAGATRLDDYVGTYASDELDVKLVVALKDRQLVLRRRPADEFPMLPRYRDDFDVQQLGSLRFDRDRTGRVTGFGIFAGRVLNVRFHRERPGDRCAGLNGDTRKRADERTNRRG